jgi:hypothetical protein
MKLIRVIGLRRAGNHAIIMWLAHHFNKGEVLFLNDIDSGINVKKIFAKMRYLHDYDVFGVPEVIIYSHEEVWLKDIKNNGDTTIVVVRDPYNLTASRIKMMDTVGFPHRWFIRDSNQYKRVLRQHMSEALKRTHLLSKKIIVNFNKWWVDKEYRGIVSQMIGYNFCDDGYGKMLPHGGGSSFDKVVDDTRKLKVLNRWKEYMDNSLMEKVFFDEGIAELSCALFGGVLDEND